MSERRAIERPAHERLWELVPRWYKARDAGERGALSPTRTGILEGLVRVLGAGLDVARADVHRLLDDHFVETCDPRLIPLIGDLVGVSVMPGIPAARQRHMVKNALHGRRRRGTAHQLEIRGWQLTGFDVRVKEVRPFLECAPPRTSVVTGATFATCGTRMPTVSGPGDPSELQIEVRVAWPVRRTCVELVPGDGGVHFVVPGGSVGLRHADGTPIFHEDDARALVGSGREIEVAMVHADSRSVGPLQPRFMALPSSGPPPFVPHHCVAIDPERGRVAGPTAPSPGVQAYRRFRLTFWEPLEAELVEGRPAARDRGIFAFSPHNEVGPLVDPHGVELVRFVEGACRNPTIGPGQRYVVVREPGRLCSAQEVCRRPFLVLPRGVPYESPAQALEKGLGLDTMGLGRFFSIHDIWGFDVADTVRLVDGFSTEVPPDGTIEVDLALGLFRPAPDLDPDSLTIRFFRPYHPGPLLSRLETELRQQLPLGRSASFRVRDTAPHASGGYHS